MLVHALPIFHTHGLFVATHCVLMSGARMLFLNRFDTDTVIDLLPRATAMMGVPTFYTRLLASPRLTREACAGIRLFVSGSAPLLADTFQEFEARTGHVSMPGVAELSVEPIKNPVTGKSHHAMIRLHTGFEFRDAEMASGTATGTGEIKFDFAGRYAFLSHVHYTPYGIGD